MRVSLSLHLKYKQCWDKQVQLEQTVNVFLVLLLYTHIYIQTYKMLKNGAVYYIHLYFPYILKNVVSYKRVLPEREITSICKYDGILEQECDSITFGQITDLVARMVITNLEVQNIRLV